MSCDEGHEAREQGEGLIHQILEAKTIEEMGARIASLPAVEYGRSKEMLSALNLQQLTNSSMGIKFVDLDQYSRLDVSGSAPLTEKRGGVLINVYKTTKAEPEHVCIRQISTPAAILPATESRRVVLPLYRENTPFVLVFRGPVGIGHAKGG